MKKTFYEKRFGIINDKNTAFISIPLIETKNLNVLDYGTMKKAFQMKFLDKLYSLKYQKNLLKSKYPIYLLKESLNEKGFILKVIKDALLDKSKLYKLKRGF